MTAPTAVLSATVRAKIDAWLKRYPAEQKRSGVMQALHFVQEENQHSLTESLMDAVADYLEIPRIAVYEVATFYSMYNLQPMGRHIIDVCTNLSCSLNGASEIVTHLKQRLQINLNETTADGKFTLRGVECLAACIKAPVMQIGRHCHEQLTPQTVDEILATLE